MRSELLHGLRMLDLSDEKGALCGKMFADMGAEVIKVEPPQGCPTRGASRPSSTTCPDWTVAFISSPIRPASNRSRSTSKAPDGRALLETS